MSIVLVSFAFTGLYVHETVQAEDDDFVVVTSFYPMYIAAMNVVGDAEGVTLKNLSEPQTGCLHDFQLTPADMKLLSSADVFIINGGGIESFMEEVAAQYPDLTIIEASEGIEWICEEMHAHEEHAHEEHTHEDDAHEEHAHEYNAHVWMSISDYRMQVENIAEGLAETYPAKNESFLANAKTYDGKLEKLQSRQQEVMALAQGQEVISLHCAYDYVIEELNMETVYCMDLDEERKVSAGEVAQVLDVIRQHGVKYIFAEELYGTDMCELIQKEADVTVLYLDPLNRGEYDADSYLIGMENNLKLIEQALR